MKAKAIFLPASLWLLATMPALAHHSFAMFANDKVQSIQGTVKQLEWVNPHAWIHVTVVNGVGKPEDWAFEMGGPGQLAARGWTSTSVSPGDKITVTFHPMRDGSQGGSEMSVKLPDGRVLGGGPGAINTGGPGARGF